MPNFCQVRSSCLTRYQKDPLKRLIGMQKNIEIYLLHYEIPQPSPCCYLVLKYHFIIYLFCLQVIGWNFNHVFFKKFAE